MYLKGLTVLGFKSFADKTSLNFLPGVSAIVGPNGCGKSNVSDAVRWVLGEQSAKALRGSEMADVIFNGTDSRKPLGMAEVSLTISDVEGDNLKAAGVAVEFNEVTVTRRVFRDGASEYFINKTPCRLKDIQQLFMGTGVGRSSYSIMAQGNITQIISSKPEDRRMVFEEAAGITKFKAQKKESLRKLEHTDQNLLRVQDLIREVKRQIGSLQRQAGKARRFKQLMQELQHLDTQLARHHFDVLQGEISERQTAADKLRIEIETYSADVQRGEDEVLQLRAALAGLEDKIIEAQQQGGEVRSQIERHEARVHYNDERLRELDAQNAKALSEITQTEERQMAAEQEAAGIAARLQSSQSALDQHRSALQVRRDALQKIEGELINRQDALREIQSKAFGTGQQLSRVRNEINSLDLQKQGNVVRLEKLSAEKVQLDEERSRLEARLHEFAANVEVEKLSVQTSRGTVEDRQKRLRDLQQELNQAGQALDVIVHQQAEKRSRLAVLEQLQTAYEGFSAGAVAALKSTDGVLGPLTDKIRVPDQYITAIEAALGSQLQVILTQTADTAERILADLSTHKRGRASIAAFDLREAPATSTNLAEGGASPVSVVLQRDPTASAPPTLPGVAALEIIEADASVRPLLEGLINRTRIVPTLAAATIAWRETRGGFDFVTLGGEVLNCHGIYTGGAGNGNGSGKSAASVLGRKNQISELASALVQLQEQVTEASRSKGALHSEQTALQASLQQAQSDLRNQEVAIATRQGEFNALQSSLKSLQQKIETVGYESSRLSTQEEEGKRKRETLALQIGDLESGEQALQRQLAELTSGLDELRQQREAANAALTETKVSLAAEEQLCASFRQQHGALQHRLRELGQSLLHLRQQTASFINRREQHIAESADSQAAIDSLQHDRDQINGRLAELAGRKETQESEISGREGNLRDQRRRLTEIQQQRTTIEVELAQKNMAVENLRQRITEKYQLKLDDIRSECITITDASEGPPKVQTLTPEEMAASGTATNWDQVTEQVNSLQQRIEEMGPVNLVAIEEYEEIEQRHQFLTTQNDDLVKAKEQLLDVINRINGQTREMFTETFLKIRENFRNLFIEVFGGGKADLILVDEGDVLESGIDIVARPPGKQLQSISLLSGGEQTMTAVALLFSIYQVKPSPFCILDELDAPLDESNINRFIRVLQRFLEHSQFIIITHNKRTIGMADVLYGVTMQEHGVSKIVSVKFHKHDEQVTGHKPALLVPPPPAVKSVEDEEDAEQPKSETFDMVVTA
ncbi:MAG: chromosome segregation protein SMC [Pedosphaera sp.]|nr:chromosome segregation protein SMC [Pedosphaera sp.]